MKICGECGAEKPTSEFYRRLGAFQSRCKDCARAYNNRYISDPSRWPSKTCAACGSQFAAGPPTANRKYCSFACSHSVGTRRARRAIELGLARSRSWDEVAEELGYASGRSARIAALGAATAQERLALRGSRVKPFTADQRAVSARNRVAARKQLFREHGGISHAEIKTMLTLAKRCPLCSSAFGSGYFERKEIDHIIPIGRGGAHIITNVRVICKRCNLERPKDGRDLDQLPLGELVA